MEDETEHKEFMIVIDNLSRAIGELADPYGCYSLDYIEDKLEKSHSIMKKPNFSTQGR